MSKMPRAQIEKARKAFREWRAGLPSKTRDCWYSSTLLHNIVWYLIASLYIGFLLIFTHVDAIIKVINPNDLQAQNSFLDIVLTKHSNLVSLVTNIGLLLFLILDMLITFNKKATLTIAVITNLIGVMACVIAAMCAMGTNDSNMEEYGAIDNEPAAWICLAIFCVCLIVLKKKSLEPVTP